MHCFSQIIINIFDKLFFRKINKIAVLWLNYH